jgi:myosin regulatory light chain 12
MMSEKLLKLDPEAELMEAFECFDEHDKGTIDGKELREWLGTAGDKMSKEEVSLSCCLSNSSSP